MTIVTKIALMVPLGMLSRGFFKSPDILTPANTPVTAGKKMEKVYQKLPSEKSPISCGLWLNPVCPMMEKLPKNTEKSDTATIAIMAYWARTARLALMG